MIINIISAPEGGGAELLVRELHKHYEGFGLMSRSVYLSGKSTDLSDREYVISQNVRNPFNVILIRRILSSFLNGVDSKVVVHVHLTWPFFYVVLASFGLSGIKLVYTEHNTNNRRRAIPFFWLIERIFYRRYSKVICISQGVHDSLARWVGPELAQRLETVPNGSRLYPVCTREPIRNRKLRLVSVGSLTYKKNFSTAIEAFAQLQDQFESYEIIGEGPERGRLERLISQRKLEKKISLVGWSNNIESFLCKADLQLIPSLWEGFGLVAVEGMSTGLPVVASNVDGLRDVLGTNNLSVTLVDDPGSAEAWKLAIGTAIEKLAKEGHKNLSVAARSQAEKFTLKAMAERYLEVYRKL
ncbi:MAG: glycosyltransferase family 4 protein [Marinobacter sp.]|uniref:glycosyltransferase family 4 protein n=1 Tax=Marinobacter sp. TaxID=50741 RepID=UPI001B5DFEF4|nr:glycosyltransferase family 4 protein [Marinobacter sp.]MBQ0746652.1 glycosyltransferase family 4 protein [Marinobacter sp.]MBQ0814215.1 glycosyltransferase family 4 protein [Marinobacter sp.]